MRKFYMTLCALAFTVAASAQLTLEQPETKVATDITSTGFTANWGAVKNADGYCVFVYDRKTVTADGEVTLADEDFNGCTTGNVNEPDGGEDEYVDLSAYGYAQTYGWSAYGFPNFIPSMVAGLVYSPYIDLRGNDGKYKIIVSAYCNNGDEIRVESNGKNGKEIKLAKAEVEGGAAGIADVTFEFDNGCKDLFFSVINNTAKDGDPDYFDRIQVKQNLKKGDIVSTMVGGNDAIDAVNEYTNDSVTSCRLASLSKYTTSKVLYYDVYASANDFTTPNGSVPYTFVVSDFTKLVKVDMTNRTSEIYDEAAGIRDMKLVNSAASNSLWYNMSGQTVANPHKGIYIHNGKKVVLK